MKNLALSDPALRKMVLPSVIRISDARTGRNVNAPRYPNKQSSRAAVTSHALRAVMVQTRLELM
jgi:hypothetical protein